MSNSMWLPSAHRELLMNSPSSNMLGKEIHLQLAGANGSTSNVTCSTDPAPGYREMFDHKNNSFIIAWIVGGICACISLVIVGDHLISYSKIEASPRKSYYTGVVLMAPVFAITNYLALFFPRGALLFELIQHMYEAQALHCFDGETDVILAKQILLAKFAQIPPKKLDASPPLCFLMPCAPLVQVDAARLDRIFRGMGVFQIAVPLCAFIRLWVKLETKTLAAAHFSSIGLFLAENISMSYTLYCLFQLYVCTHDMIHDYKSTDKFVAIKAILGIAVLQSMIINVVVHKFIPEDDYFTRDMQSEFWADFALACEAIILSLAHRGAYPSTELVVSEERKRALAEAEAKARLIAAMPSHHHDDEHDDHGHGVEMGVPRPVAYHPDMEKDHWPEPAPPPSYGAGFPEPSPKYGARPEGGGFGGYPEAAPRGSANGHGAGYDAGAHPVSPRSRYEARLDA